MDPRSLTLVLLLDLLFTAHSYPIYLSPAPAPDIGSPLRPPQGPPKVVAEPNSSQRSSPRNVHNPPPPDLGQCPPDSRDCTPNRRPVTQNTHSDRQDPGEIRLNKGKKLGLILAATAVALQVLVLGFLLYKRRHIRQLEHAHRSTLPSSSA